MTSRGKEETDQLIQQAQDQLHRLVGQLHDLEELKDDLDEDEYANTKQDTLEQMREFQASLTKMMKGDVSLVDRLNSMQLVCN